MRDNQDLEKGGVKFDLGKLRYDLVSPTAMDQLTAVLTYGAQKYRDRNWEVGMPWGRAFAAAMRHLWAWWRGETNDPETGMNHIAHAMCNLMFLLEWAVTHPELDDRPVYPPGEVEAATPRVYATLPYDPARAKSPRG